MFDGEEWTTARKIMAATPISFIVAIFGGTVAYGLGGETGVLIMIPAFLIAGLLNFACLFMYYSDAKSTKKRAGNKPRWWAYTLGAWFFTSYLIAPLYLAIWRNV